MDVEGSMKLGNNTDLNPPLGTMRWSGSDFEVWNGVIWASMTGNKEVGSVQDFDGNNYRTIRIGSQVWMTENLRVSHYNDGTTIDEVRSTALWGDLTFGAWCWYNNDPSYEIPYGKLYNWNAVDTSLGLCPSDWHVPTIEEWSELTNALGGIWVAGGQMKKVGTLFWDSPNVGATNTSGFSGLPGGSRSRNGSFFNGGNTGAWWSSTISLYGAGYLTLGHSQESVELYENEKRYGFSVRCVKN